MKKKKKFDSSICETCQKFYHGINTQPYCHHWGKRIYEGECLEYIPVKTEEVDTQKEYEQFQEEWN